MRKRKKKCCNYLLIIPLLLTVKNALKVCSATIIFEGNCFLLCISKSKFGIYMVGVSGTGIQPVNTTTGHHRRLGVLGMDYHSRRGSRYIHLKFTFVTWPYLDILQISIWVFLGDDGAKLNLT